LTSKQLHASQVVGTQTSVRLATARVQAQQDPRKQPRTPKYKGESFGQEWVKARHLLEMCKDPTTKQKRAHLSVPVAFVVFQYSVH
jgi:hypothetical protein